MELDWKKKIIIGICFIAVIGIFIYLYYDYASSKDNEESIVEMENNDIGIMNFDNNVTSKKEEEDIEMIIHVTGAIRNPRYC